MIEKPLPSKAPRSVDELVNCALNESDDEAAWDAVCVRHSLALLVEKMSVSLMH